MKLLEDLKIKHLSALVSQQVGKSVSIVGLVIDPEIYFSTNDKEERIENSDFQYCTVTYSAWGENFGTETETQDFTWLCEQEELIPE